MLLGNSVLVRKVLHLGPSSITQMAELLQKNISLSGGTNMLVQLHIWPIAFHLKLCNTLISLWWRCREMLGSITDYSWSLRFPAEGLHVISLFSGDPSNEKGIIQIFFKNIKYCSSTGRIRGASYVYEEVQVNLGFSARGWATPMLFPSGALHQIHVVLVLLKKKIIRLKSMFFFIHALEKLCQ